MKHWTELRGLLEDAGRLVTPPDDFKEYMDVNEFELAYDELRSVNGSTDFFDKLAKAKELMGLA